MSISVALLGAAELDSAYQFELRKTERVEQLRAALISARAQATVKTPGYDSYEGPDQGLADAFNKAIAKVKQLLQARKGPGPATASGSTTAVAAKDSDAMFVAQFCAARGAQVVAAASAAGIQSSDVRVARGGTGKKTQSAPSLSVNAVD